MERTSSVAEAKLHVFFDQILSELDEHNVVRREFGDFANYIPGYDGGMELSRDDLEYLSEQFEHYKITSQPRVKRGFIKEGIDAPIYLYKDLGSFDHKSEDYRYAQVILQVAVVMARIDGDVSEDEIKGVMSLLNQLDFLGDREKVALQADAHFLLQTSIGVGGGEETRSYLKSGINKDHVIHKVKAMKNPARRKFVDAAKEIAIADGVLGIQEVEFLQDLYKALRMSTKPARGDIEEFAKEKHVELRDGFDEPEEPSVSAVEEVSDALGELLTDFEEVEAAE
ncbi:MAG: tellurite resistance TerB family protein [Halieaceae bacterium]|jgi:tellurite resistance protein|nr:tellurite resistance TerB family protein [Halieaceae bacterium]